MAQVGGRERRVRRTTDGAVSIEAGRKRASESVDFPTGEASAALLLLLPAPFPRLCFRRPSATSSIPYFTAICFCFLELKYSSVSSRNWLF